MPEPKLHLTLRLLRNDGTYEPLWAVPIRLVLMLAIYSGLGYVVSRLGLQPIAGAALSVLGFFGALFAAGFALRLALAMPERVTLPYVVATLVGVVGMFGVVYSNLGLVGPGEVLTNRFGDGFYFSVITFTTVGYGDFRPSPLARPFAAAEAAIGYLYLGLFVAFVTSKWAGKPLVGSSPSDRGAA